MSTLTESAPSSEETWRWSARQIAHSVRRGEVSPVSIVERAFDRIDEADAECNAVCHVDREAALRVARQAEREVQQGDALGALHGVPVLVKDMLFTRGMRTTGGSRIYHDFVPSQDDVSVERLRAAGAIVLGKTNTAEFGFSGNQTDNLVFGETRNPWDRSRTPGGSSGGSAAAVAAGMAPVALGTDGGGSIRIPSSFCGVFGLKPTFGRVPLHPSSRDADWPGFSGWESLEHVGPITRDVRDAALVLDVLSGFDGRDRHSVPSPDAHFLRDLELADTGSLAPLRIGFSADWGGEQPLDDSVRQAFGDAVRSLSGTGAVLEEAHPACGGSLQAFGSFVEMDFDVAAVAELCAGRENEIGTRLRQLIASDKGKQEAWSLAIRLRKQAYAGVTAFFDRYDVLVTPTTPVAAFGLGLNGPETVNGVSAVDPIRAIVGFCCPFNLTGHPAASVPWAQNGEGLPIGVQVVAPRFREDLVLRVSLALEQLSGIDPSVRPPS